MKGWNINMDKIQGWNSEVPVFKIIIDELKPKVIVEVGSWKGASAMHMASLCDAKIYCIDTWLGGVVSWIRMDNGIKSSSDLMLKENGYPGVYEVFIKNIEPCKDRIIPMPMSSWEGCELLKHRKINPDLIYIDASHFYDDVLRDAHSYWEILKQGGVMFFDDYINEAWPDTKRAVDEFIKQKGLTGKVISGKMVIEKKGD